MGRQAAQIRKATERKIRPSTLSESERAYLREKAAYEGSPYHKRNPGDFGLTPPSAPRPDKTLCDEAGITRKARAKVLFDKAINAGLVSEASGYGVFPKQIWIVDDAGRVFEAMYGGSQTGCYHGYPIRHTDPFFNDILEVWEARRCGNSTSS